MECWESKDEHDNEDQTSYLSKDLRDRNFGPQKFTQKKTEFAIKQVRDKIM